MTKIFYSREKTYKIPKICTKSSGLKVKKGVKRVFGKKHV